MSYYEENLARDKTHIRERVAAVGKQVEKAICEAVNGLLENDHPRCYRVILGDLPINREIRAIDKRCHAFVARHLPSAGHLRFVSSVMRMDVAIERIGDYAVTIARHAVQMHQPPPEPIGQQIRELAEQSCEMLKEAVKAFDESDAQLARATKPKASEIGEKYGEVFRRLAENGTSHSLQELFALIAVFSQLERVSDQAKNICEEVVFELTGETKPPKVYRVLFVDEQDTLVGPLATAIARKAFPETGDFKSAGTRPGEALNDELSGLSDRLGLDLDNVGPSPLPSELATLGDFHVIVSLCGDCRSQLGGVPFHTAYLEWETTAEGDPTDLKERIESISQRLSGEIGKLMITLRGEEAG